MTTDDVSEKRRVSRRVGEMKTPGRCAQVHHHTCRSVLFAPFSSFKKVKLENIPVSTAFYCHKHGRLFLRIVQIWFRLIPAGFWNVCFYRKNLLGFKPRTERVKNHQFWGWGCKWQKHAAQVYHQYYIWSWVSTVDKEHHNMMQHFKTHTKQVFAPQSSLNRYVLYSIQLTNDLAVI